MGLCKHQEMIKRHRNNVYQMPTFWFRHSKLFLIVYLSIVLSVMVVASYYLIYNTKYELITDRVVDLEKDCKVNSCDYYVIGENDPYKNNNSLFYGKFMYYDIQPGKTYQFVVI